MIFKPPSPVRRSTSGGNSSHTSTSGSGNRTATSLLPSTSNFFVDLFVLLWYLSAIAALLSEMRVLTPDSIRVRAESRYFLFQVSTKDGTSSSDRGPSVFNSTHNWHFNALYHFPNPQFSGFAGKMLSGWWVAGIETLQTGY